MKEYLIFELKAALIWIMAVAFWILRWLFRWLLRLGMLALLLFLLGGGCYGIFRVFNSGNVADKNVQARVFSNQAGRNIPSSGIPEKDSDHISDADVTIAREVKSAGNLFESLSEDFVRFMARH